MRLLLSVLGVFMAVVCIEKPAEAEQNYPWCINKPDESPQCRYVQAMLRLAAAAKPPPLAQ
jgi:hypothetical protein